MKTKELVVVNPGLKFKSNDQAYYWVQKILRDLISGYNLVKTYPYNVSLCYVHMPGGSLLYLDLESKENQNEDTMVQVWPRFTDLEDFTYEYFPASQNSTLDTNLIGFGLMFNQRVDILQYHNMKILMDNFLHREFLHNNGALHQ